MLISAREPTEKSSLREPCIKGKEGRSSFVTGLEFMVDDRKQTSISNLFYFGSHLWTACSSLLLLVWLSKQIADYPFRSDGRFAFLPLKECCPRFSHYMQITLSWQSKCKTWVQAGPCQGSLVNSSLLIGSNSGNFQFLLADRSSYCRVGRVRGQNPSKPRGQYYGSSTNCATHI
jgi:hypothetical protein